MVKFQKFVFGLDVVFLFCSVFTPDLFPIPMMNVTAVISGIVVMLYFITHVRFKVNNELVSCFLWFLPFIIYTLLNALIRSLINPNKSIVYLQFFGSIIKVFIYSVVVCFLLVIMCNKNHYTIEVFYKILIIIAVLQLFCVITSFLFPNVRDIFVGMTIRNSKSELLQSAVITALGNRVYGLSSNLFDSFGYIVSILIVITFSNGLEKRNWKMILLSTIMLFMPLMNARVGILLALIGMIICFCYYFDIRKVMKYFLYVVILIALSSFVISRLPAATVDWLKKGAEQTIFLLSGKGKTGIYSEILFADIVFPSDILFGAGATPHIVDNLVGIDNGYINCLWGFGIAGSLLLFSGFIHMFYKAYKIDSGKQSRAIIVSISVIFFINMVKIYPLRNFGSYFLVCGVPAVTISCMKRQLQNSLLPALNCTASRMSTPVGGKSAAARAAPSSHP